MTDTVADFVSKFGPVFSLRPWQREMLRRLSERQPVFIGADFGREPSRSVVSYRIRGYNADFIIINEIEPVKRAAKGYRRHVRRMKALKRARSPKSPQS